MPTDTLICGICQKVYTDLTDFVSHKQDGCTVEAEVTPEVMQPSAEQAVLIAEDGAHISLITTEQLPPAAMLVNDELPEGITIETPPGMAVPTPYTGKKRGRPRKGQEKTPKAESKQKESPPPPERGEDGKLSCTRCKKTFTKERHFRTHKCLATSDYVDITKKELVKIDSGDELSDDEEKRKQLAVASILPEITDLDPSLDFEPPLKKPRLKPEEGVVKIAASEIPVIQEEPETIMNKENEEIEKLSTKDDPKLSDPPNMSSQEEPKMADPADKTVMIADADFPEQHRSLPIFQSLKDKEAFESKLNVDLSCVDHLFKVHIVQQNTNEFAPPPSSRTSDQLSLYSCTVCAKIFKSLSHARAHCIIHTDLRPFRCFKCNYSTNTKGNLYTHVRKHTGQVYRCRICSFTSVNRGHLVEHEATHTGERPKCGICKKSYSTPKSLINHIRQYHKTKTGRDLLSKLSGTTQERGVAILHQCPVCNRKFKKKNDRDRHLFVHKIRTDPSIQSCELCGYTVSRRIYLERHMLKHRTIYRCVLCNSKFPSTIRLNQHLTTKHEKDMLPLTLDELFSKCIDNSLYLPEPEAAVGTLPSLVNETQNEIAEKSTTSERTTEPEAATTSQPSDVKEDSQPSVSMATTTTNLTNLGIELEDTITQEEGQINLSDTTMPPEGAEGTFETEPVDTGTEEEFANEYLFKRLRYRPMTMDIFQKIRLMFGNEECEVCGRLFYCKSDHESHYRIHTGDRPYACDQCDFRALTKDNLKRHIERQHIRLTFPCPKCDYVAETRQQLWRHEQKHRIPTEVACPKCDVKMESMKKLKMHLTFMHPEMDKEEILQATVTQPVKPHGKIGKRSYKCPYCPRLFLRASSDLQKHIWIHQGVKPFKCHICPHACRSKNNLAAHMLRHSKDKPFLCNECGKAYKSKTALRWHVRTHKDGKMFKCPKCSYAATQKSHLKRHLETHYITKKYVCAHCDYSANTIGYMKIHYTRKHKGLQYSNSQNSSRSLPPDAKVYRCLSCDYMFGNLTDMKRHLKVRHHIQLENVDLLEGGQVTQIVPVEDAQSHVPQGELQKFQIVELENPVAPSAEEEDATTALQTLRYSVPQDKMNDKPATAVSTLQQIIDISQQSVESQGGAPTLAVADPQGEGLVILDQTTLIAEGGQEVVLAASGTQDTGQYYIQYITQADIAQVPEANGVEQVISAASSEGQVELIQSEEVSEQSLVKESEIQVDHVGTLQSGQEIAEQTIQGASHDGAPVVALPSTSEVAGVVAVSGAGYTTIPASIAQTVETQQMPVDDLASVSVLQQQIEHAVVEVKDDSALEKSEESMLGLREITASEQDAINIGSLQIQKVNVITESLPVEDHGQEDTV